MKFRSTLSSFLACFALAGCTSNSGPTLPEADFFVSSGQAFALRLGDTVGVVGRTTFFIIRFSSVLGDNRCPEDVTCVQAGAVSLVLTVQTSLNVQDVTLDVPPSGGVEIVVANELRLQVIEVAPPARQNVEIDLIDYAAAMAATDISAQAAP